MIEMTDLVNDWLVEAVDPQPGQTVLDIASRTGISASRSTSGWAATVASSRPTSCPRWSRSLVASARPAASLAFAVWRTPDRNPWAAYERA
jgi:hypothetical protein